MKKTLAILSVLLIILTGCEKPLEPVPSVDPEPETRYEIGQEITYADQKWHIINEGEDYLTVVSAEEIIPDSIYFEDDLLFDTVRYFTIDKLQYDESGLKIYLEEELLPELQPDNLKEVDGYKIRMLTLADLENIMPLEKKFDDNDLVYYTNADGKDYSWLIREHTWFWTMEMARDDIVNVVYGESMAAQYIHYSWYVLQNENGLLLTSVGNHKDDAIKVVINILKEAL